ncbi:MAG: T9SS type A sorting domain-containing protein, partial [Bacteroidales bacterium]|nr:T9SS type A sorting domain-containing protein [Bacteroidales bacterium]
SLQESVQILDLTGKVVKSFPYGETEKGLNISNLPKGIYFVKIGIQTQKIVVE